MVVSKYCASGNDFLIFHSFREEDRSSMAVELCNRFYGIGADGLVVLLPYVCDRKEFVSTYEMAYKWEFYNSDGSIASMCGNASRAVGLYAFHNNLASKRHSFLTGAGVISINIQEQMNANKGFVQSNMGNYTLEGNVVENRGGKVYEFEHIIMRIPHLVYCANSMKEYMTISNDLEFLSYMRRKYNANVNVAFKENDNIHYVTFERGIEGITQACGTGAGAVYVSFGDFDKECILIPPSKEKLRVSCIENEIYFAGLVVKICDSYI